MLTLDQIKKSTKVKITKKGVVLTWDHIPFEPYPKVKTFPKRKKMTAKEISKYWVGKLKNL